MTFIALTCWWLHRKRAGHRPRRLPRGYAFRVWCPDCEHGWYPARALRGAR